MSLFRPFCLAFAPIALAVCSPAFAAPIAAVGVYDENAVATNVVDKDGDPSGYTVAEATSDLAAGFASNTAGVVNFDTQLADYNVDGGNSVTDFDVALGGGRELNVALSGDGSNLLVDRPDGDSRVAISGVGSYFGALNIRDQLVLTFGDFTGLGANEGVLKTGIIVLGRSGGGRPFSAIATYTDGSTSAVVNSNYANFSDTFIGFEAPDGLGIESITIDISSGSPGKFTSLDDLVIATGVIPEPGSLGLATLGVLCLLSRRRCDR